MSDDWDSKAARACALRSRPSDVLYYPGCEVPAYYPESVRRILQAVADAARQPKGEQ